ncbi:MAG: hypothetical protein KME03_04365 [Aphanocapsa lilacina HA4352-LM1]|jgi:hypothetical protein|nr:hypothetical protein [Aphanocapsa lilacina HA4352-LM1]
MEWAWGAAIGVWAALAQVQPEAACSGLPIETYTAARGESAASIARARALKIETLLGANPAIQQRPVRHGDALVILPRDGILYRPEPGEGFPEVAARFRVRGEVLFEMNGCRMGERLFVPGVLWKPPVAPVADSPPPAAVKGVPTLLQLPPPPALPPLPRRPSPKSKARGRVSMTAPWFARQHVKIWQTLYSTALTSIYG